MRRRLHRRTFLQLSAALSSSALVFGNKLPRPAPLIASTLRVPFAHHFFPNAAALVAQGLTAFDLWLVPAYAAAELIRKEAVQHLTAWSGIGGSLSRAHDPDGAFTVPYAYRLSAILYRDDPPGSLDDLWRAEALWPDCARLVIGAALLRRGYSLNDAHAGHLAHIEQDLIDLRPRFTSDPRAAFVSGRARFAFSLIPTHAVRTMPNVLVPSEGAALVEYDWVIPRDAPDAQVARDFIIRAQGERLDVAAVTPRLTPITPLPASALAQRDKIWARLKARAT
jgi:hypothetical protein